MSHRAPACAKIANVNAIHETAEFKTDVVSGPVPYATLRPGDATGDLPLLVLLHGGGASRAFLADRPPLFERAWVDGTLPPLLVATPSAARSFYLDNASGTERWETFVAEEFIPHLEHAGTAKPSLVGISMGGMGALRLAFRNPDRYAAVAALEAAIETTAEWSELPVRDRFYRPMDLLRSLYGDPINEDHFRRDSVLHLAVANRAAIAASDLATYIECGDEDALGLHHGVDVLHRTLFDIGLEHEYRLVRGANHVGRSLGPRFRDALGFIGRAFEPTQDPDEILGAFEAGVVQLRSDSGYRRTETVPGPAGPIEVTVTGEGPAVVLIPSLGRGAADFDDLSLALARHGYTAVAPEPRGIGGSTGELDGLTMHDLAADTAAVIEAFDLAPATVVGHAFGNRVTRMTATEHPDLVESVILLCCGGSVPPAPEISAALQRVFDTDLSDDDHLAAVELAFFAPGNDPAVWFDGWYGIPAYFQGQATRSLDPNYWIEAGESDILIVQPVDDLVAVPSNAQAIVDRVGDRATVIEVPDAGHALLPEQPEAVASAILGWLRGPPRTSPTSSRSPTDDSTAAQRAAARAGTMR